MFGYRCCTELLRMHKYTNTSNICLFSSSVSLTNFCTSGLNIIYLLSYIGSPQIKAKGVRAFIKNNLSFLQALNAMIHFSCIAQNIFYRKHKIWFSTSWKDLLNIYYIHINISVTCDRERKKWKQFKLLSVTSCYVLMF